MKPKDELWWEAWSLKPEEWSQFLWDSTVSCDGLASCRGWTPPLAPNPAGIGSSLPWCYSVRASSYISPYTSNLSSHRLPPWRLLICLFICRQPLVAKEHFEVVHHQMCVSLRLAGSVFCLGAGRSLAAAWSCNVLDGGRVPSVLMSP